MFPLLVALAPLLEGLVAGHAITTVLASVSLAQWLGLSGDVVTLLEKDPNVQAFIKQHEDTLKTELPKLPSLPKFLEELKAYAAANKQTGVGYPADWLAPSKDATDFVGQPI